MANLKKAFGVALHHLVGTRVFFEYCFVSWSEMIPSLKLTANAPENGGPLESRRFRTWKPPFLGGVQAASFREGSYCKIHLAILILTWKTSCC